MKTVNLANGKVVLTTKDNRFIEIHVDGKYYTSIGRSEDPDGRVKWTTSGRATDGRRIVILACKTRKNALWFSLPREIYNQIYPA